MQRFVGRREELSVFLKALKSPRSEFAVVYGRRRVGKTALIKEFLNRHRKDVFCFYHTGGLGTNEETARDLLRAFERLGVRHRNDFFLQVLEDSIRDFVHISQKSGKVPVLVFDEFPRTAQAIPGLQEKLQYLWDGFLKEQKVLLIFSGSSIGMLERIFKEGRAPLCARSTRRIFLKPFGLDEFREFYGISREKGFLLRSCIGGLPWVLENFKLITNRSLLFDLVRNFFELSSPLFEEPLFLLSEEVEELPPYWSVCKEIALCDFKIGISNQKIMKHTGLNKETVSKCLHVLERLELIVNDRCLGCSSPRWKIYDEFLGFWFRFVEQERDFVFSAKDAIFRLRSRAGEINDYIHTTFEIEWRLFFKKAFPKYRVGLLHLGDKEFDIVLSDGEQIFAVFDCKFLQSKKKVYTSFEELVKDVRKFLKQEKVPVVGIISNKGLLINDKFIAGDWFPTRENFLNMKNILEEEFPFLKRKDFPENISLLDVEI